ncbi:hypothetical protein [Nonomuraea recticatena]|uniref:Uncharacterized protein n=1 Tax=Nonomuraea recticatena TaxID=46178 RepID=A0ABP6FZB6_9ACTN
MSLDADPSGKRRRYDRAWWLTFAAGVMTNTLIGDDFSPWIRVPVGTAFLVALIWLFRLALRERERERKNTTSSDQRRREALGLASYAESHRMPCEDEAEVLAPPPPERGIGDALPQGGDASGL